MSSAARTALVTGGARRIGRAIVEDLAVHGFAVAIHCNRSRREGDSLGAEIRGSGGRAAVVEADLTDAAATDALIAEATKAIGPIGLLVNSASIFEDDSVEAFDPVVADRHFAIHVNAPAVLARRFAEALPDGEEGLIVNVIDQRVWRLTPEFFSYTIAKAGLYAATQTLAQALAPHIRVNAIGPGPVLASIHQTPDAFAEEVAGTPLRRATPPEEIAAAVRFILDAPSMTGQMIALDAGQHLVWPAPRPVDGTD